MKKKIFVRGPVLSQSGYGEQARFALRALKSREDLFDIYVQPIAWGKTGWVWETSPFRDWMDNRIAETQSLINSSELAPDISLQITIPNEFKKMCPVNIGYTAGMETNRVAPVWLQHGNDMDKILVVSNHAKETYEKTVVTATNQQTGETTPYKMTTPVEVVHECTPRREPAPINEMELEYDFNYLMVSQFGPRKNFENALRWWVEEFIDQEVGLVVKTNFMANSITDWDYTHNVLKNILSKYSDRKCKVYVLHGDCSPEQMAGLYENPKIRALVNIAHGEGFGLPMFEAARAALPIVCVGWSGHMDFLQVGDKDYFCNVDYKLEPVQQEAIWEGVIEKEMLWAYADQGSYKMSLRKIKRDIKKHDAMALELQSHINENFSEEKLYAGFCKAIYNPSEEEKEWMQELSKIEIL